MRIQFNKVLSRNIFWDLVSRVQNFFGMNLKAYESMIDKGMNEIEKEISDKGIVLKWHMYAISELNNGALVIILYGETK
jgi:molybdopterin synthase catalytic subunit